MRGTEGVSNGRSAIDWIEGLSELDPCVYPTRFGAEVRSFDPRPHLRKPCAVQRERSVQFGLVAAQEALEQAQLLNSDGSLANPASPISAILGTSHGPCYETGFAHAAYHQRGPRAVRPSTIPKCMFNSLSAHVSIHFGLTDINFVVASACASGASAIGIGMLLVRYGHTNIVLAGGADSPFTGEIFASWNSLRVMASNPDPARAARPFDKNRNGLVLGEGAGIVILEDMEHAQRRGAMPLAIVHGHGTSSDATDLTAPSSRAQAKAMAACLADAALAPKDVGYVNAHGTGTPMNDKAEAHAISFVFGASTDGLLVSSTKSMLGHALGASGAIECIVCVKALECSFAPPTLNCDDPDPEVGLDYLPHVGRTKAMEFALTNSFGFGGSNVSLMLGKRK